MSVNVNKNINSKVGDAKKPETPWKNGYWYSYSTRHIVQIVDGNSVKGKMHTVFDFPEAAEIILNITWTFGDFGQAKEVISEATGNITNT